MLRPSCTSRDRSLAVKRARHRTRAVWRRFITILVVLAAARSAADAQEAPAPGRQPVNPFLEDEAPPALFNLESGSTDVDLYVLGSWTASSHIATGFAFHPPLEENGRRVTVPYEYPGFETVLFAQTVDLTLSLWLYERFFFEASFADESNLNTIAAGYYGREGELVRELVVGNVPLAVQQYPYQYAGSPEARSGRRPTPGTVLRLETERTYHELLVQLENSRQERVRFSGGGVVEEVRIAPESYLRERLFVLPDRGIRNLEVYLEDEEGSVLGGVGAAQRRFRALNEADGEYVADLDEGTLRLGDAVAGVGTVAVYYETSQGEVGDAANGTSALVPLDGETLAPTSGSRVDFSFSNADLYDLLTGGTGIDGPALDDYELPLADGRSALIVARPGLWSPFEAAGLYALPQEIADDEGASDSIRIALVSRGTRTPIDDEARYQPERIGDSALLLLTATGTSTGELEWRYPFAGRSPREANASIYGPLAASGIAASNVELLVSYRSDRDSLFLDGDIVPGTVVITENGRPLDGAEIDSATGEITLPPGLSENATIDVSYRVYSPGDGPGDLVLIAGNRWRAAPALSLSLASGLRWTISDQGFSEQIDQNPGQLTVSAGAEYTGKRLSVDGAIALQVSQADTTGFFRIFGGSPAQTRITPDIGTLFPASAPTDPVPAEPTLDLTEANRRYPRYRDYWETDALGGTTLAAYTASRAVDAEESGARIGPYLASSLDDDFTGTVAVLEWDDLGAGEWLGAQIRVSAGEIDLRDATSVTVWYRYVATDSTIPTGADPALTIQLGSAAEDLDGDGVLDEGRSAVDPLLDFDGAAGLRRAGQDAPIRTAALTEDGNANGLLDIETPTAIYSGTVSDPLDSTVWREVRLDLDSDDRSNLAAVRAARIILTNGSSATDDLAAGRILVGRIEIERTEAAYIVSRGGGSATVAIRDDPAGNDAADGVRSRFDLVGERFAPDEEDQRVLELDWSGATADVEAEIVIPEFAPNRYGTLRTFMWLFDDSAVVGGDDELVEIELAPSRGAADDEIVRFALPAREIIGRWRQVDFDLNDGTVLVDGVTVSSFDVRTAPEDADFLRLATLRVGGLANGTLYLDELHAADPLTQFATAARVDARWTHLIEEGRLTGGTVTVEQSVDAQSDGFQSAQTLSESGSASPATVSNRALSSRTVARFRREELAAEVQTSVRVLDSGSDGAFGHRLAVPVLPRSILTVEERFLRDYSVASPVADRNVAISSRGSWGSYRLSAANLADSREIEQSWAAVATPPTIGPVAISLALDLAVRSLDREIALEDYASSWVRSTEHFVPLSESGRRQERRADGSVDLDLLRWSTGLSGGWTNRSSISSDQDHRVDLHSELPIEFDAPGRRPWRLVPSYRRDYFFQEEFASDTFAGDADGWAERIASEPQVFSTVPIVELFQRSDRIGLTSLPTEGLTRRYDTEARVAASRAFASRPRDLWVPSDVEALVRRERSWEADSSEEVRLWQMSLTAVAINLYGTEGSRRRFNWYRSDEFRNGVVLGLEEAIDGSSPAWSISLEQQTAIFGHSDNELEVVSRASIGRGETTATDLFSETTYAWRRNRYPRIAVFDRMEVEPYYRHEERLSAELSFEDAGFVGSEVLIGHRTVLVVGTQGELSLYGDIGWLTDPGEYESGMLHVIGFQAGIEAKLTY